jgi:uncharacterized membrane protein
MVIKSGLKLALLFTIVLSLIIHVLPINSFFDIDEVATQYQTVGYGLKEIRQEFVSNQNILEFSSLLKSQTVENGKGIADVVQTLRQDDPHLTPFYFGLNHLWMHLMGHTVPVTRLLPFLINIASLFGIYWLCLELFQSELTGWLAATFLAASPIYGQYSIYVRFYSLTTLLILISTTVLLRALRTNSKVHWAAYSLLLSLSFYTYLFSGLVAGGHLLYGLVTQGRLFTKTQRSLVVAFAAACVSFVPWLLVILAQKSVSQNNTNWLKVAPSLLGLVQAWLHNFSAPFLDISQMYAPSGTLQKIVLVKVPDLMGLLLIATAFYILMHTTERRIWVLVVLLTVSTVLPLMLLDSYLKTILSVVIRYLLPAYLGILLAVAYLFSVRLTRTVGQNHLWQGLLAGVLVCCLATSGFSSLRQLKKQDMSRQLAATLGASPTAIVACDELLNLMEFAYEVKPTLRALLLPKEAPLDVLRRVVESGDGPLYVFPIAPALQAAIAQSPEFVLKPIFSSSGLPIANQLLKR